MTVCQCIRPLHLSLLPYTLLLRNLVRNYDNGVGKFDKDVCRYINKVDEFACGRGEGGMVGAVGKKKSKTRFALLSFTDITDNAFKMNFFCWKCA